jgi:hypothetical protein
LLALPPPPPPLPPNLQPPLPRKAPACAAPDCKSMSLKISHLNQHLRHQNAQPQQQMAFVSRCSKVPARSRCRSALPLNVVHTLAAAGRSSSTAATPRACSSGFVLNPISFKPSY